MAGVSNFFLAFLVIGKTVRNSNKDKAKDNETKRYTSL